MIRITGLTAVCTIAAAVALSGTSATAAGKCVLAGGEATMVTGDLARFMANAALNNSIKGMGAKASGAATVKCTDGFASVYCKATQRACK